MEKRGMKNPKPIEEPLKRIEICHVERHKTPTFILYAAIFLYFFCFLVLVCRKMFYICLKEIPTRLQ